MSSLFESFTYDNKNFNKQCCQCRPDIKRFSPQIGRTKGFFFLFKTVLLSFYTRTLIFMYDIYHSKIQIDRNNYVVNIQIKTVNPLEMVVFYCRYMS